MRSWRRLGSGCRLVLLAFLLFATPSASAQGTQPGIGFVTDRTVLRTAPDANSDDLVRLDRFSTLRVLAVVKGWLHVEFTDARSERRQGYVEARFVNVTIPPRVIAPPPPPPQLPDHGGVKALDEPAYAAAVKQAASAKVEDFTQIPFVFRMQLEPGRGTYSGGPYVFSIETPYTRVAKAVARAKERYEVAKLPSLSEANAAMVEVVVQPGNNFTNGQSIQRVIVKRDERIIEAVKAALTPRTYSNALGAKRELNTGVFTFPFEAFAPGEPLTIVLIGSGRPFEWPMRPEEVLALR